MRPQPTPAPAHLHAEASTLGTRRDEPSAVAIRRPALRWHGGKWRLAPWIIRHLPAHDAYLEPYGGAASVLLRKPPAPLETINDLHGRLVNFFTILRSRPDELVGAVELTPYARAEFQRAHQQADDPLEDARRLYVLANQGRGGAASGRTRAGWRAEHNPTHRLVPPRDFTAAHLRAIAARLKHVQIEHADALAVIARYDSPGTLHYVDPPYVRAARNPRSQSRYAHDLSDADHRALAALLHQVQGMVVLSGYPSELYAELYDDWQRLDRHARDDAGGARIESLWRNPAAAHTSKEAPA